MVIILWIISLVAALNGATDIAIIVAVLGFFVLVIRAIISGSDGD